MSRNRRKNTNSLNLQTVFIPGCILLAMGALAFFWVYQKNQLVLLGNEIKSLETKIETARQSNQVLAGQVAMLKSTRQIAYKNEQWSLGLVTADPSQFVTVQGSLQYRMARNDGSRPPGGAAQP